MKKFRRNKATEKMKKKKNQKVTPEDRRRTLTLFMLLFPSLIITAIAAITGTIGSTLLCLALFFYQAVVLKNYVESRSA